MLGIHTLKFPSFCRIIGLLPSPLLVRTKFNRITTFFEKIVLLLIRITS